MNTKLPNSFRLQFVASTISNVGDGMVAAAAPLLTLTLTSDPRLISGVTFASFLPWLLLSLPAGVYIDRFNRKTLMVTVNFIRAILFTIIAICAATDTLTIWWFMLVLVGVGICEVIFDMSAQAFLPQIVPGQLLEKANGMLSAAESVANNFVGLPIGAWAFVAAVGLPFGIDAATFAIAALLVARIRIPVMPVEKPDSPSKQAFILDLRQGISWLIANPLIRTLAILLGVVNMTSMFGGSILVKYSADILNVTGRGYGLLLSVFALGSTIGGFIGHRIARALGIGRTIVLTFAIFGLSGLAFVFFPHVWSVALSMIMSSIAGTTWNIVTVSLRQRLIPTELFGRVNSVYRFVGTGSIALGAIIGGQIAYRYGLKAPFLVASVLCLAALAWGAPRILRAAS